MFRKIKKVSFWLLVAANILAILLMAAIGNVDHVHPVAHPLWANLGLGFPVILAVNAGFLVLWVCIRFRMVWLPLLGLLLCYVPIRKYIPFNPPKELPHGTIKVLSYNVYLFAPWDLPEGSSNPIIDYIIQSKADIVCLQEANAGESKAATDIDPIAELAKHYEHIDTVHKQSGRGDVLMVLSRYPILRREIIPYESDGNISVAYTLDIRGTETLLVNNHLESYRLDQKDKDGFKSLVRHPFDTPSSKRESAYLIDKLGEASALRAPQAEAVARYVAERLNRKMPVILCGDFNDNPISYAHRTIAERLTDCYIASGNGPGISYHKSGMLVRIDHILCSSDFEPYGAKVDDRVGNSDHYPIFCRLKYRPKP